jgi:dihydroorotase
MRYELVVEGNAFYEGRLVKCCIGIENQKIRNVKKILKGERHIDVGDKLILPAGIDAHVHFREPGLTHKEDFSSGTSAAARGGIAAVLDMPNTTPPAIRVGAVREKYETVKKKAFVDYGLFGGLGPRTKITPLLKHSDALKIYMGPTTGDLVIKDYRRIVQALRQASKLKKTVSVHCEDESIIPEDLSKIKDTEGYNTARPPEAEIKAVQKLIEITGKNGAHIAHVSTPVTFDILPRCMTCEVTPHHMFLHEGMELGPWGKVNPPIRDRSVCVELFWALVDGKIDMIASDHAPHTIDEKDTGFCDAPAGIPGVETMLPLMFTRLRRGDIQIERLVEVMASAPARIFKLQGYGKIKKGNWASIMTVDMRQMSEIKDNDLLTKCGWTPYGGVQAIFPRHVFIRGDMAIEDQEFVGQRGWGRPVHQ